jgi:hypothetical protein
VLPPGRSWNWIAIVPLASDKEAIMIDADISNTAIAVMCDIARASGLDLNANKRAVLDGLIAQGLVEVIDQAKPAAGPKFAITLKGQQLLDKRGVGVNEA